ncbi:HXXEE domain-containing protein [Ciceribacter sp. L1K22]|uniref:HXXEE domain-containing protein n=1 Tax=Ciceribacter sp. L1K22 TaxID=2820275 RepID=UPI001ABE47B6|nr:HXXEE domain-containing protein [Ciceribacter sp. L1K22]MBO3762197.1 HXXEE domain-containing protein [Ciceribacter sp. L1K22]
MLDRLYGNWVYGGALSAVLLLALCPLFLSGWSVAMIAVFLQLPIYMIHQYEEHDDGRFGRFINAEIGGGKTVLSDVAIFVINVPGVWGVNALSIWLATLFGVGFGLIGVYLTLVNALVHIGPTIRMRRSNPGLITAVLLFLPVGLWALMVVAAEPGVSLGHHALGIASAVLIHLAIVAFVFSNRRRHNGGTVVR